MGALELKLADSEKEVSGIKTTKAPSLVDDPEQQIFDDLPEVKVKSSPPRRERPAPVSSVERVFGKGGQRYNVLSAELLLRTLPPGYPMYTAIDLILTLLEHLQPCIKADQEKLEHLQSLFAEQSPNLEKIQAELDQLLSRHGKSFVHRLYYQADLKSIREKIPAQVAKLATTHFRPRLDINLDKSIPHHIQQLQQDIENTLESINDKRKDYNNYFLRADELIRLWGYFLELAEIPSSLRDQYLANDSIQAVHQKILKFKKDQETALSEQKPHTTIDEQSA